MVKEFLYVGWYFDTLMNFILKIGTTNDLERRRKEHTRNYRKAKNYTMPSSSEFQYLWHRPLSKYNTLRYEDRNRQKWIEQAIGEFVRNDRFNCGSNIPKNLTITIRKDYEIIIEI